MKNTLIAIAAVIVLALGAFYVIRQQKSDQTGIAPTPIATASYACDAGKTIDATYYAGTSTPAVSAGQPPVPGGSVALTLSDGRTMTLPQTISADGTRYANADESFVFWSKGNGAFTMENNQQAYMGCIQVVADQGGLPNVFESGAEGISLRYPAGYTADPKHTYQELGPGKSISGVSFTIASSSTAGTNLGADSYVSVEELPATSSCTADLFLDMANGGKAQTISDNGMTYSVASTTGAGAGNRYEETVYALPGTNPCIGVRYFVHYGVFENYPAGTVTKFDEPALLAQFDQIRRSLTVNQ